MISTPRLAIQYIVYLCLFAVTLGVVQETANLDPVGKDRNTMCI